jgi:hypothetical protein
MGKGAKTSNFELLDRASVPVSFLGGAEVIFFFLFLPLLPNVSVCYKIFSYLCFFLKKNRTALSARA